MCICIYRKKTFRFRKALFLWNSIFCLKDIVENRLMQNHMRTSPNNLSTEIGFHRHRNIIKNDLSIIYYISFEWKVNLFFAQKHTKKPWKFWNETICCVAMFFKSLYFIFVNINKVLPALVGSHKHWSLAQMGNNIIHVFYLYCFVKLYET